MMTEIEIDWGGYIAVFSLKNRKAKDRGADYYIVVNTRR